MTWSKGPGRRDTEDPQIFDLWRSTTYARNFRAGGAAIDAHYNYPGSPAPAFGRLPNETDMKWPVVTLRMPFQVDEFAKRDRFIKELQALVDKYADET